MIEGIHHFTRITSSAEKIYDFFTRILGMRLVKKTINQDDINTYHLFFSDDIGSYGTDMTFFDFKGIRKRNPGTNSIYMTGLRVPTNKALEYYQKRFIKYDIKHEEIKTIFNHKTLKFYDFDDAEYILFSDENNHGVKPGIPWKNSPIPDEYAIYGLGPVFIKVDNLDLLNQVITKILKADKVKEENNNILYEFNNGGNGAYIIASEEKGDMEYQGFGSVHHVAFTVDNEQDIYEWTDYFNKINASNSGFVDRFYFKSLYTRLYPNILFELATKEPGFIDDQESYETLGTTLALPPKFRDNESDIKKLVRHIDTTKNKYDKEYL